MNKADRIRLLMAKAALRNTAGGALHGRSDDYVDADMHVTSIVVEQLTGTVDDANRVFYSTYVPRPTLLFMTLLFFRGLLREQDDAAEGYRQLGKEWHMGTQVVPSAQVVTDATPIVIYLRQPGAFEGDFDPSTMGSGRRRHSELPEPVTRRKWRRE